MYTSPFIWIPAEKCNIKKLKEKLVCKDNFSVEAIQITDKIITGLAIKNESLKQENKRVFVFKKS